MATPSAMRLFDLHAAVAALTQGVPDLPVTTVLREGYPKEAILGGGRTLAGGLDRARIARASNLSPIVFGLGLLAVATNAPCSVEIVRKPLTPSIDADVSS